MFLQADPAPASTGGSGPSAIVEMMSNMGGVALAVLVVLLFASLYSWTIILGKISAFGQATKESRRFIRSFRKASRLQEIAALAVDCKGSPLAQVFEDVYETYKRQTGGLRAAAESGAAGALGADGCERSGDGAGTADDVAGDDCGDEPVCGFVRDGVGRD